MKIAILSDIHDQLDNLRRALKQSADCDVMICCGDLNSPFVARELGDGFPGPIHVVFGNNDGDRFRIAAVGSKFEQITFHGEYAELAFDRRTFAVQHFDNIGRALAKGDAFDVVCFGHNHQFELSRTGDTQVINPGEIFGQLSGSATFVKYDTASGQPTRIDL